MHSQTPIRKIVTWSLVFSALASTTFVALTPNSQAKEALAYTAAHKKVALVLPYGEQEEKIVKKITKQLYKRNLICTINSTQAAYLAGKYETQTQTLTVKNEPVTLFEIKRARPNHIGDIRRYLRATGEDHCVIIPSRSWYYLVLDGQVS
jgi:hypothetical protein